MNSITTIFGIYQHIKKELLDIYSTEESEAISRLNFEHILNYKPIDIHTNLNNILPNFVKDKITNILSQLKKHTPIQYILGSTEFYGLPFKVATGVLIPRPETEELVDWILKDSKNKLLPIKILDIGTGSGCIAVTLAKQLPCSDVYALDISEFALDITTQNAQINNTKINTLHFDILEPDLLTFGKKLPEPTSKFDIIVSNPPYIRASERTLMQRNVLDFEPESALFVPDSNPLLFYEHIANFALHFLTPDGALYFEINEALANETSEMLTNKGFENCQVKKDLNGKNRMIKVILPHQFTQF
jgi:release factor glutamine methyltransferase